MFTCISGKKKLLWQHFTAFASVVSFMFFQKFHVLKGV